MTRKALTTATEATRLLLRYYPMACATNLAGLFS